MTARATRNSRGLWRWMRARMAGASPPRASATRALSAISSSSGLSVLSVSGSVIIVSIVAQISAGRAHGSASGPRASRLDDQRPCHARVELAEEGKAPDLGEIHPRGSLRRQVDVKTLVAGGDGVAEDVVVLPGDRVADMQLGRNWTELHVA